VFSDRFAAGVLAAALDRGLAVPGALSIIGFDDSPVASNSRPALTTVRQDLAEKGHAAAASLVAAVQARTATATETPETPDAARHVVLPVELVIRESTAPPTVATLHDPKGRSRKAPAAARRRAGYHQE